MPTNGRAEPEKMLHCIVTICSLSSVEASSIDAFDTGKCCRATIGKSGISRKNNFLDDVAWKLIVKLPPTWRRQRGI
jgi:hypothetical protein